ncbi:MAG: hypothetical protein HRU15_10885 [Planctomycetes bacterium]|nr:hypothetical protein [Planctomycetota bacterium]
MNNQYNNSWFIEYLGIAPWFILPIACIFCALIIRLGRNECDNQQHTIIIASLRCAACCFILLLLCEPSLTSQFTEDHKAHVAIVIDNSSSMDQYDHSMHPYHSLNEAQALNYIQALQRPTHAQKCSDTFLRIQHLRLNLPAQSKDDNMRLFTQQAQSLQSLHETFLGHPVIYQAMSKSITLCKSFTQAILSDDNDAIETCMQTCDRLINRQLTLRLQSIQKYSDQALMSGQKNSDSFQAGLAAFKNSNRQQRSIHYATQIIHRQLSPTIDFTLRDFDGTAHDINDSYFQFKTIDTSDFNLALQNVHRDSDEQHIRSVVLISDGIMNSGSDPRPLARAFSARSIPIHCIRVGDPHHPRDAAILKIDAPNEAHQNDDITISVRYRINGYPQTTWVLQLFVNNEPVAKTRVQGNNSIQENHFSINANSEHILNIRAEISPSLNTAAKNQYGLKEEIWSFEKSPSLIDFFDQNNIPQAQHTSVITMSSLTHNNKDQFIRRLRGYLKVPKSGQYTFWLNADDNAELWISMDKRIEYINLIAHVSAQINENKWDKVPSQKSQTIYLEKDQSYFIDIRHRDHSHKDHLYLAWNSNEHQEIKLIPDESFFIHATCNKQILDAEASTENNIREHSIAIHSDPLRILLVDTQPRWISRLLVSQLQKDQRIDIDHHYLTGSHNQSTLPNERDINNYDIIILGDIAVHLLDAEEQERISIAVQEFGTSLICIAGRQAMPHAYSLGPLADILPVHVRHAGDVQYAKMSSQISGTGTILSHTCMNIWQQRLREYPHIPQKPIINWINNSVSAKEHAQIHLVAQFEDQQQVPLVVSHHIGAGHVLYIGSDDLWSMRKWLGVQSYKKWWESLIQWGSLQRLHGQDPRLHMSISHSIADSGEEIYLRARAQDNKQQDCSESIHVRIQRIGIQNNNWSQTLHPAKQQNNSWTTHFGKHHLLTAGQYRISISSDHPDIQGIVEYRDLWIRKNNSQELNTLKSTDDTLHEISDISGGLHRDLSSANDIMHILEQQFPKRQVTRQHRQYFWHGYGALLCILGLLSLSWWYRKRIGLP